MTIMADDCKIPLSMDFEQFFKEIPSMTINEDVFATVGTAVGKDFHVVTAGREGHYNSMMGSGGGLGLFFKKPTVWSILRADRYTLEMIEKEQSYTLSFFPDEHKEQTLIFGDRSGRDSEKMKEVKLTSVQTPAGNVAFEEARLIIECKLQAITTIYPDDICSQEAKDFVREEYKEKSHYRKVVFGEITHVWVKV
jgi:Conserved protein/domain typically associated with flavoprotein oxygenases, DIM6/NTAB family